jgi:prepilin-type N-terminal cleavage/methylation domain-containing protein
MKLLQEGITLLEVLIAIAILGIVSAIALPNLAPMLEADRADNFINELSRTIKYARAKATATDELVIVCPISNPTRGGACTANWQQDPIVAFVDIEQNLTLDQADDMLIRSMLPPNSNDNFKQIKGNSAVIVDAQGRINSEHQFVICPNGKNDHTAAIQVNPSGNTWNLGRNVLTC